MQQFTLKTLWSTFLLVLALMVSEGVRGQILTFEFSALGGSEVSASSNTNDANLTSSTITRGTGLTASGNSGRFNATNWALTSIANAVSGNNYMEFTITPQSGYQFSISSIVVQWQRSSTGNTAIALRSSADGYATDLDAVKNVVDNTSTQTFTWTFTQSNSTTAVTYRFYSYAESTAGSGGPGDGSGNDIVVNGAVTAVGGNQPPQISNIVRTPANGVSTAETVSVSADVTDSDGTIEGVELHWGTSSGVLSNTINMTISSGNTYTTVSDIPAQLGGTTVYYEVYAIDDDTDEITSVEQSYTVNFDQPTNHVTGFSATTNSHSQITVNWTDAVAGDQAPAAYLVKAAIDPATPTAPADGTAEVDGALVKNINHGAGGEAVFTGLDPETTYNFAIWPYTNSGTNIDYKIGLHPTASATTDEGPCLTEDFSSESLPIGWIANSVSWSESAGTASFNANSGDLALIGLNNSNTLNFTLARTTNTSAKTMYVEASTTSQTENFTIVATYDHGNTTSGSTTDCSVDLSPYSSSETVYIRFRKESSTTSPWRLDNIEVSCGQLSIWTGTVNTNWSNAGNWTNGIPDATTDVTIPASKADVIIASDETADCNNLTVEGSLTIKSGALNTGSLIIHGSATGNITAERYIAAASDWINANDGWHLLASPVASQAISGAWTPDGLSSNDYDFYAWSEAQQLYLNQKLPANNISTFDPGIGYLVAYQATATPEFTGAPNTTNQTENLTLSGVAGVNNSYGYNLLGNPFQSAIDWSHASWDKTGVGGVAKIWNSGAFIDIDDDPSIIPAMNGFFVSTSSNNNSFTIPAAARVHNSQNWYKSKSNNTIKLVARDAEGKLQQESRVRFNSEATDGFDQAFDGPFMTGYAPLFYSTDQTHIYSTNTLPNLHDGLEIEFGFIKNGHSTFEIELAQTIEGVIVYLNDNKTSTQHNLTENPVYHFTASEGDNPNRFVLHFGALSIDDNPGQSPASAYVHAGQLYILNGNGMTDIRIVDVQGRLLQSFQQNVEGLFSTRFDLPAGMYIIQLQDAQGVRSNKVVQQ